jgi:hypothetical protein
MISKLLLLPLWTATAWHAAPLVFRARALHQRNPLSESVLRSSESPEDQERNDEDDDWNKLKTSSMLNNAYSRPTGQARYNDALEERGSFISRMLSPRPIPINEFSEDNEDGWSDLRRVKRWKKVAKMPIKVWNNLFYNKPFQEPGTLILIRHGESSWNANQTFTGWR